MPILNPPTSPPNTEAGDSIYKIGREWCMGDTVRVFNNNFVNIDTRLDNLSSNLYSSLSAYVRSFNIVDSATLDLTYSTTLNRLSGNVIDGSINTVKLGGDILQAGKALLTAASLSALRDTRITNLGDNHILTWNSTSGVWINLPNPSGPSAGVTVGDKGDIIVSEFNNQQSWTIDSNAVDTNKIANFAVTPEKLSLGRPQWNSSGNVGIAGAANPSVALTVYGNISASGTLFANVGTISNAAKALDVDGGLKGQLLCQLGASDTDFVTVGSPGQILQSIGGVGDGRPVWVNQNTLTVRDALSANYAARLNTIDTDILNPTINRLVIQRRPNETIFLPAGTQDQILTLVNDPDSTPFPRPAWTNGSSITVGFATRAYNLSGNSAFGSIPYQTGSGTTQFTVGGISGQILQNNGSLTAPSWVNQSSITAGKANAITSSVVNGVLYQSGADTTTTVPVQTTILNDPSPYILTHNGGSTASTATSPKWQNAASLKIGNATQADLALLSDNLRIQTRGIVWHDWSNSAPNIYDTKVTQFGTEGQILSIGAPEGSSVLQPIWINASQLGKVSLAATADNKSGGLTRQLLVQTSSGVTDFVDAPTTDGQLLIYRNNNAGTNRIQWESFSIPNDSITADKLVGTQTGSAPIFGNRAWCNFPGTATDGPVTITAQGNISQINRTGIGQYTVTFVTPLQDDKYAISGYIAPPPNTATGNIAARSLNFNITSQNAGFFTVVFTYGVTSGVTANSVITGAQYDPPVVHFIVVR